MVKTDLARGLHKLSSNQQFFWILLNLPQGWCGVGSSHFCLKTVFFLFCFIKALFVFLQYNWLCLRCGNNLLCCKIIYFSLTNKRCNKREVWKTRRLYLSAFTLSTILVTEKSNLFQICVFFLSQIYQITSYCPLLKNIARGTTNPGYWVYNLSYLFDCIEFVFILAAEIVLKFRGTIGITCKFVH